MAYVIKEEELPSLIDAKAMRERIFFVNQELAKIDDMLAGVMHYKKGAASPLHLHKNCEHFYFIINGKATVESDEGMRPVGPGDMIFNNRDYNVEKGSGIYLGPSEAATIQAGGTTTLKLFHLVVPKIPKVEGSS